MNAASAVLQAAREVPDAVAVLEPAGSDSAGRITYRRYTNQQLDRESDWIAFGLESVGIDRGVRTALMVPPSFDLYALVLALFKVGAVPVLVDPGLGRGRLFRCLEEAAPEAFVGVPLAQAARRLLGWGRASVRRSVTVGRRWLFGGPTLAELRARGRRDARFPVVDARSDEEAAILFTSGSTGPPKGVVYRHGNFLAQVEALRALGGIRPGEIDVPTFPPFALFDPALGMTAVIPEMDPSRPAAVDPRKIVAAVAQNAATNLFGSPALLDAVGRYGIQHGVRLPTLTRVITAGAAVPAPVIERFLSMLPEGAQVLTPYGATECLPVSCIGSRELLGETAAMTAAGAGVCVGAPVPSVEVRILAVEDGPIQRLAPALELPRGEIGEIVVRGPQATDRYEARPEATRLAKIADPEGGGPWHRMGDLGYLDERGRLWFCGRKGDRVRSGHGTLHTVCCEAVFDQHPQVRRTALVGVGAPGRQEPVLCVELEPDAHAGPRRARRALRQRVEAELAELASRRPHTKRIRSFLFHRGLPVDIRHNAKLDRRALAVWAARRLGVRRASGPPAGSA